MKLLERQDAGFVTYWKYPSGGASIASITDGVYYPYGVVVSLKQI
jgi:hypothetical protein